MLSRITLSLLAFVAVGIADPIHTERLWTGTNGKSIRGTFIRLTDEGKTLEILTPNGQVQRVAVANLAEPDSALIKQHLSGGKAPAEPTPPPSDPADFRDAGNPDRNLIPSLLPDQYGSANQTFISSFCNFLLWWDEQGILPIPKSGSHDRKAEWIHDRMARHCGARNNSGISNEEALLGIKRYFATELKGVSTLHTMEDNVFSPENIARYTTGGTAAILRLTLEYKNGGNHSLSVAVTSADARGNIAFLAWGKRIRGSIVELAPEDAPYTFTDLHGKPVKSYEILITNREDVPERLKQRNPRLTLHPHRLDKLVAVKPCVYIKQGNDAPPPADPLFDNKKPVAVRLLPAP